MASRADKGTFDSLLQSLVAHRLVVYLGGLLLIALPAITRAGFDAEVPAAVRTTLVVVALGAMILTYLGERRVADDAAGRTRRAPNTEERPEGDDRPDTNERSRTDERARTGKRTATGTEPGATARSYSRRTRTTVAIGLSGIAIGIYVAVEIDTIVGVLFVLGGLLFGQSAFRDGQGEGS